MSIDTKETTAEAEIRAIIEETHRAIVRGDLETILKHHGQEIVAFDAIRAIQFKGFEAYKKHWEWCTDNCPGGGDGMEMKLQDLKITASEDLAFAHFLNHVSMQEPDGAPISFWLRLTICFQRQDGAWKAIHEHCSQPFDPESGKVLFGAQP